MPCFLEESSDTYYCCPFHPLLGLSSGLLLSGPQTMKESVTYIAVTHTKELTEIMTFSP
jgi:hypothetical protein